LKISVIHLLVKFGIPVLISFLLICLPAIAQENEHTIKSGETLSSIAKKYKTTVPILLSINPEAKAGIKAGGVLKISTASKPELAMPQAKEEVMDESQNSEGKHKVKSGESLFKISKKYKVTVAELEKWNGISNSGLKAGMDLWIKNPDATVQNSPEEREAKPEKQKVKAAGETNSKETANHTISKGETLSTIARKYATTPAELKKLNLLKSDKLNPGQVILVPEKEIEKPISRVEIVKIEKEAIKTEKPKEEVSRAEPKKETKPIPLLEEIASNPEQKPGFEKEISDVKANTGSIREVNNSLGYTRIVETGFAEGIEGDLNSKKHLCLHKNAAIGSILQVKNEANGQSVFVKVIGKLPDTGSNEKLIIRVSRQAYDRLLAVGKRFSVEVSYPESQP